jgi:hypothetical protein
MPSRVRGVGIPKSGAKGPSYRGRRGRSWAYRCQLLIWVELRLREDGRASTLLSYNRASDRCLDFADRITEGMDARRGKTRQGRGFSVADSPVPKGDGRPLGCQSAKSVDEPIAPFWNDSARLRAFQCGFQQRVSSQRLPLQADARLTLARRPRASVSARHRF